MRSAISLAILLATAAAAQATNYNLFIVSGQSNAVGFDTYVSQLPADAADANIPFFFDCGDPGYDAGVNDSSSNGAWTTLQAQPKGNPLPSGSRQYGNFAHADGGFGPEMSFARDLYDAGVPNVAIMKFAYSGTAFQAGDWHKGQHLYDDMLARYAQAKAALEAGGANTVTLKGLVWLQGESDSGSATYEADLTDFIADMRSDYGVTNLPVLCGLKTNFNGSTYTVVQDQQDVAAADANVWYVNTTGAQAANSAHFSSAGVLDVGSRCASVYLDNYQVVPEPASVSLLMLGAFGLLVRKKR